MSKQEGHSDFPREWSHLSLTSVAAFRHFDWVQSHRNGRCEGKMLQAKTRVGLFVLVVMMTHRG